MLDIIIFIGYLDPLGCLCPILKQSGNSDNLPSLCHLNPLSDLDIFFFYPDLIPDSSFTNLSQDPLAFPSGNFGIVIIDRYEKHRFLLEVDH